MKNKIMELGINEHKIKVVHNWADSSILYPISNNENPFIQKHNLSQSFIVMYSGNIGYTQELENLIEVAAYFQRKKSLLFIFVGEGANKVSLMNLATRKNLTNVKFFPYQSKKELNYSLNAANLHIISTCVGLKGLIVPSKVYSILACGKPFIGWVDEGSEIDLIAKEYKCGFIVPPGNITKMAELIEWGIQHQEELKEIGKKGREVLLKCFDRSISVSKFNQLLSETVG